MNTLLQDARLGFRMLAKNPGFTAVAVITLALGIGANSTIFSWINSTMLDPIPGAADTSRLVAATRGEWRENPMPPFSYPDYVDLRSRTGSFSGLIAYQQNFMTLTGNDRPERLFGEFVSANYFDVLGVPPLLGRSFSLAEEEKTGTTPAVIISYALWQSQYGGDRSVVGKSIEISKHLCTIVGVAPPGFIGCAKGTLSDLWVPLVYGNDQFRQRGSFWLDVFGRLKHGVTRRQAEVELDLQMQRIVKEYPDSHRGPNQITLDPLYRSPFGTNIFMYKTLPMLLALAAVLLLLGCANVANLLLVRSVARRRELALRLSMGAGRWRLLRQLLVESLLLALVGGGVAMLLTGWTAGTLAAFIPNNANLPLAINGYADRRVLAVTVVISILAALIFGALPALRSSNLAPITVLKEEAGSMSGGVHKSRLSRALVVAQISLSLLLLISAGLFTRSLRNAERLDPGFDPNHVLVASYDLGALGYSRDQGIAFHRQLLSKISALPGVESATLADFSPLSFTIHSEYIQPDGYLPRTGESMLVCAATVSPNYLRTMRIPIVDGREFSEQDTEKSQLVAIVNEEFVNRYWPRQDAIGKRFSRGAQSFNVVGVARNGKYRQLIYPPEPVFYVPLFQSYRDLVMVHARVSGDPRSYAAAVEKSVHELNADLPVFGVTTLKASMQFGSIFERLAGTFASAFGLLALALAAVGIYGVIGYTTRQRTHEIAIRIALGARPAEVLRLVLGQGMLLTLAGLAVGIGMSLALTRYLKSVLFGINTSDLWTYAGVTFLLCLVSLIACYIPARRATKVDPMEALRYQ